MDMKQTEKNTARRVQVIAVCCCLCLLAVGAGVTYRAFDKSHLKQAEQTPQPTPVTAVQTPQLEIAMLERNQQSKDDGEEPEAEETSAQPNATTLTFTYPVKGEVVLPYSVDHAIYDPTLEQYRTNASISLSAKKGTAVKAAAAGTVQEIAEDAEMGRLVVIAHADGWQTIYGQLAESLQVAKGDTVQQGQVIGSVDSPTKYGTALGSHLDFAMEKNGTTVDPLKQLH